MKRDNGVEAVLTKSGIRERSSTSTRTIEKEKLIVRFAGDSGDGMQVVGARFTDATAVAGNDLATLPDFPAEIRAPAGTPAGVSAFQIHFASRDIQTPRDHPHVLVAMNPAALKANLAEGPTESTTPCERSEPTRSLSKRRSTTANWKI